MTDSMFVSRLRIRYLSRWLFAVVLFAAIALVAFMVLRGTRSADLLEALASFLQAHRNAGHGIYLLAFLGACMIGVVPLSLVAMVGGALYGIVGGFLLSTVAMSLGAMAAFLMSRYAFRASVYRWLQHRVVLARMDEEIARSGWRFVLLLRLSPLLPFSMASYAFGLTVISPASYFVGTLGALPGLLTFVCTGALSGMTVAALMNARAQPGMIEVTLLVVGLAATVLANVYLVRIARRAARADLQPPSALSNPDN